MDRQERLVVLGTFVMGMIFGVYVYFVGYSPVAQDVAETVDGWTDELVVVGEAYGGCDRGDFCPTFRIADDGVYRYFYRPADADEQVLREGAIPRSLERQLRQVLSERALAAGSEEIAPAFCESYVDGIDVRYTVTFNETEYILDSCGTAVDGEGVLWQTLSQTWEFFETVG